MANGDIRGLDISSTVPTQSSRYQAPQVQAPNISSGYGELAGAYDYATKAVLKGFQALSNLPFVKTFMPWVTPFLNGVSVIFDYTPLVVFKEKYNDIVIHGRNLEAHGLTPETLPAAVREMEGAIAMGTMISGMGWLVAMSGGLTGSMPHDPEERRLW